MNPFFPQWHGLAYAAHPISQGFQQLSTKEESLTQGISERSRTAPWEQSHRVGVGAGCDDGRRGYWFLTKGEAGMLVLPSETLSWICSMPFRQHEFWMSHQDSCKWKAVTDDISPTHSVLHINTILMWDNFNKHWISQECLWIEQR